MLNGMFGILYSSLPSKSKLFTLFNVRLTGGIRGSDLKFKFVFSNVTFPSPYSNVCCPLNFNSYHQALISPLPTVILMLSIDVIPASFFINIYTSGCLYLPYIQP